jgi:6-pyruvoyltetrahydropterin/6-carboxytetrahydropterin synthase
VEVAVFELTVKTEFCAAHAIVIAGTREPNHGHNWRVTATIAGETLDADGLLCDFHEVERALKAIVSTMHNNDLNTHRAFQNRNASAENVARHIFEELDRELDAKIAPRARVTAVRVTESVGCAATYRRVVSR